MSHATGKAGGKERHDYGVTLGGALFAAAMVLIGLAAINTQQSLLFVVFGAMLGASVLSAVVAWRMLGGVSVSRDLPGRAFAGRVVHLGYDLRQLRRRAGAVGLEVTELDCPPTLQAVGAYCLYLPPGGHFRSGSRLVIRRRGRLRLRAIRLTTRFPFSLIRARRDVPAEAALIVWPSPGALRVDILARGAAEVSDAAPSQARSGADEFFGLREYRQGDSPRWIHWKRTASTGRAVVREMSKPRPDVLYIILDTQPSGASAEGEAVRERLIRFAATLAEHAFHRQFRVGLAVGYAERVVSLPDGDERGRRTAVLDALAEIDDNRRTPLVRVAGLTPRRHLRDAHVVVITPEAARAEAVYGLRGLCRELTVVTPERLADIYEDDPGETVRR